MNIRVFWWVGVVLVVLSLVRHAGGQLTDSFDVPATPATATQLGSAPGPTVQPGGPDGAFLQLIHDGVNSQANHYTYDRTDIGAYNHQNARFDFRIASSNNPADGFSFQLIPTATFGLSGDGPGVTAEEPNGPGMLAVGFDLHPAGTVNDISLHWDGTERVNYTAQTSQVDLDDELFHRAELTLSRFGNSSLATMTITTNIFGNAGLPSKVLQTIVPMLLPYENRVQLAGRSGGLNMDVDLDNVRMSYIQPYIPIPIISTERLYQDFDLAGSTPFFASQHVPSLAYGFRPGPLPMNNGDARAVFLRLVQDEVSLNLNSISFDHTGPALASHQRYTFAFRFTAAGPAADGIGMLLLPVSTYGMEGAGVGGNVFFEEPNLADILAVGFDLHPAETVNDVSIHWDGSQVTNITLDAATQIDLDSGVWHQAAVTLQNVGLNTRVSMLLHPDVDGAGGPAVVALDQVFLPGVVPYQHRIQFGGRTGGLFVDADLDDVAESIPVLPDVVTHTVQDFDAEGTAYEVWQQAAGNRTSPTIRLAGGGPAGTYLHLLDDQVMNQRHSISLHASPRNRGFPTGAVTTARFDFRAHSSVDPDNPGDGFSLLLIPTEVYGERGPGATYQTGLYIVEKPNLPGVFGVGFDLYRESEGVNDLSVHWNGGLVHNVRMSETMIDLDQTGTWHRVECRIEWGAVRSTVAVSLIPDIYGTPGAPISVVNEWVGGLTPFDFRVELAGRSGSATHSLDLDKIEVFTIHNSLDQDGDGLPDRWEMDHWNNLAATDGLPGQDWDHDGFNDFCEWRAGTDPKDPASLLVVTLDKTFNGAIHQLEWPSVSGKTYAVARTKILAPLEWTIIQSNYPANPPRNLYFDPVGGTPVFYYRVEVEGP